MGSCIVRKLGGVEVEHGGRRLKEADLEVNVRKVGMWIEKDTETEQNQV